MIAILLSAILCTLTGDRFFGQNFERDLENYKAVMEHARLNPSLHMNERLQVREGNIFRIIPEYIVGREGFMCTFEAGSTFTRTLKDGSKVKYTSKRNLTFISDIPKHNTILIEPEERMVIGLPAGMVIEVEGEKFETLFDVEVEYKGKSIEIDNTGYAPTNKPQPGKAILLKSVACVKITRISNNSEPNRVKLPIVNLSAGTEITIDVQGMSFAILTETPEVKYLKNEFFVRFLGVTEVPETEKIGKLQPVKKGKRI